MVQVFAAPIETLFDAWVRRDDWQAWLGPQGMHCEISHMEPVEGGSYRLRMLPESGAAIAVAGTFRTVARPHRLAFTWGIEGDVTRQSLITLSFRSLDPERTELTLRQEGLGSQANRDAHEMGWRSALQKLAAGFASEYRP